MKNIKIMPEWAQAMVNNWRALAQLPLEISDDLIFTIVEFERLYHSSNQTEEDNQEAIDILRSDVEILTQKILTTMEK